MMTAFVGAGKVVATSLVLLLVQACSVIVEGNDEVAPDAGGAGAAEDDPFAGDVDVPKRSGSKSSAVMGIAVLALAAVVVRMQVRTCGWT